MANEDGAPAAQRGSSPPDNAELTVDQLEQTIDTLDRIAGDRGQLLKLSQEQQERFLRLAGLIAHPGRAARRQIVRAARKIRRAEQESQKRDDEALLEQTGIRRLQSVSNRRLGSAPPHPQEHPNLPPSVELENKHFVGEVKIPRNCYICKRDFYKVHFFYDSMCPECAEFNWLKRNQSCDLSGRYAVVTGGRVKIGFEACLKLLRAGAHVTVTTRFPRDAASRFAGQEDCDAWIDRLQVYGLDLRQTPAVEAFAAHLAERLPRLDFLLNNACQTVRRPPKFYEHLMEGERERAEHLPAPVRQTLESYFELEAKQHSLRSATEDLPEKSRVRLAGPDAIAEIRRAAELSQIALLPEDQGGAQPEFPLGKYDRDLQQIDLRDKNSWRLKLAEVSTIELLEVQLVNAVAPFILNARLKPLMLKVASPDKHIVNVSAMEGIFYRAFKRDTHPHTNMAKAALNMLTRTSALDYIKDGIHMNSVDTGWITDEDPAEITQRKKAERGFSTPLDTIDAAARICDPIFSGLLSGEHQWGKFLKDYQVSNW